MKKLINLSLLLAIALLFGQVALAQPKLLTPAPIDDPCDGCGGAMSYPGGLRSQPTNGYPRAEVFLWDDNYGAGNIIYGIDFDANESKDHAFATGIFGDSENDETRSATFVKCLAGRTFTFYDSPDGSTSDDYTVVTFLQDIPANNSYVLNSFEYSYTDLYVSVTYHGHNGLDGKVSRVSTHP